MSCDHELSNVWARCSEKKCQLYNKCGLLTRREVKMAGWILAKFFLCVNGARKSRGLSSHEKERGQYPAVLTEQENTTVLRDTARNLERAR